MPRTIEQAKELTLPMIAVRGTVAFPGVQMNLDLVREMSLTAFAHASEGDGRVLLLSQKDAEIEDPGEKDFYHVGTVCQIKRVTRPEEGGLSVVFEGICRAKISSVRKEEDCFFATVICKTVHVEESASSYSEEKMQAVLSLIDEIRPIHPILNDDIVKAAKALKAPGGFCDFVASAALLNYKSKQRILEVFHPLTRLDRLLFVVEEEFQFIKLEYQIHRQVKERLDQHQKEYFLREQAKVIQQELGEDDDEIAEYHERIEKAELPDDVREKLFKELGRLSKTPFGAAESAVLRSYLDTCLELPWCQRSKDVTTVSAAREVLDADHAGLEKIKERILEYIAVKQIAPNVKNQIICLVGPPGVGKTSIAASIARAMKRKYARISLGGIRDEADIRGHRKTYVGAMPGRIVEAITTAGTVNPVLVLDEIDKLATGIHGDPASALLEVLDPEQNKYFRDHFLELPLDLSECVFIATANDYDHIPLPLIDRMEIIRLSSYTRTEKFNIAKRHLVPKQLSRHGLKKRSLRFTDEALFELIDYYTREAGVRTLEREIASLCRKSAMRIAEGLSKSVTVTPSLVAEMLGKRKFLREDPEAINPVGVVNGLAYTQSGGDLLKVEALAMEGTGKLTLTGSLGDVMKESAQLAVSYIRTVASSLGIPEDFYKTKDIHIHFPEGAIPKDGPSAGVAMCCALASALSGAPTRRDVAMTGEITLHGKVLPIGGLKEKTMAAYASGIKTVLIPKENEKDLDEIDSEAKAGLRFVLCETVKDAYREVLLELPVKATDKEESSPLFTAAPEQKQAQLCR